MAAAGPAIPFIYPLVLTTGAFLAVRSTLPQRKDRRW
jgi:hypothetical protein